MASRADSARIVLRWLRDRKPVMLGADMDYGARNSTFVPFFGVPTCTLTAVGRLAKVGHAQVVPFIGEVLPNYKGYRLKVFKPWENYPTGDDDRGRPSHECFPRRADSVDARAVLLGA